MPHREWCFTSTVSMQSHGRFGSTGRFSFNASSKGCPGNGSPMSPQALPLCRGIERAHFRPARSTDLFVLGNHGLVLGGDNAESIEKLLAEARRRLSIHPRKAHPADYAALWEISMDSPWDLPDDDDVHALGTDATARAILSAGLLYPCQAIFSDSNARELFRPVSCPHREDDWQRRYGHRPFLIIEGRGVIVRRGITPAELAMLSGLAQVVQRLITGAPVRYLTDDEVDAITHEGAHHYRELSGAPTSRGTSITWYRW